MAENLNDLTCFNCGVKISKGVICTACEVIESQRYEDEVEVQEYDGDDESPNEDT